MVMRKTLFWLIVLVWVSQVLGAENPAYWWYEQAQLLYQEGDREGALALLLELEKRFPEKRAVLVQAKVLAAQIYFDQGEYQQVIKTLRPLIKEAQLPAQAFLLLAQAAERLGLYDEALTYLRYLKRRFPEEKEICTGNLVAARIFIKRKLKEKANRLATRVLKLSFCTVEEKAQAISLLLQTGQEPQTVLSFLEENPQAKRYAPEILKVLALWHLKAGKISQAETEIFEYLNYSGDFEEAPVLLYTLAEAYYQARKYRAARRLFELILTSWPHKKEALLAKFRLYQMRYLFEAKIGHKSPQTRRMLIAICNRLEKEYPQEPLTEEALALHARLLFEEKRLEESLTKIWTFLQKYPASRFKPEVLELLCKVGALFEQGLLAKKEYQETYLFLKEHQQEFEEARCGASFYFAAEACLALALTEEAKLILLEGYDLDIPEAWAPDYHLTLADLLLSAQSPEEKQLARQILTSTAKKFPSTVHSPYFIFLQGRAVAQTEPATALKNFKTVWEKALDQELKERAARSYWDLLIKLGRFEEAFSFLKENRPKDLASYKLLAVELLAEERLTLARKVISALEKMSPEDPEVQWLKALWLEKEGEEAKALSVWGKMTQGDDLFGSLAAAIVEAARLVEATREEIY